MWKCWGAFLDVPSEEGTIPGSSDLAPGAASGEGGQGRAGDLRLNSALKVAPSLFSFLSGFKAASKFLRSQILPGTARKRGQQRVRAVCVPAAHPGPLLSCG